MGNQVEGVEEGAFTPRRSKCVRTSSVLCHPLGPPRTQVYAYLKKHADVEESCGKGGFRWKFPTEPYDG